MSGYHNHNHATFNAAAKVLRDLGHQVVNPAELDETAGPCSTYQDYYRRDLPYLARCQAVVVLPGWKSSTGAKLELAVGKTLGMPVYRFPDLTRLDESELPNIVI